MANVKATKTTRSIRSIRSNRSGLEKAFREETKGDGDVHSFDNMLIMACARFQCPFTVTVTKETKQDYIKILRQANPNLKPRRISVMPQIRVPPELDVKSSTRTGLLASTDSVSSERVNAINVTMVYDNYNTLMEILITKVMDVPRALLRIISLLLPYYRNLTRITICKCGINMYSIYELSKVLCASTITEVCLDGSPVLGADYTMLLETTKLRYLSLSKCNIQDDTCKLIAVKLQNMCCAQNLLLLNLSTNRITDEGAKHISNALRTNRHLRYLDLSDNHITDCGAGQILDVLIEFPLTYDEMMGMRRRRFEYLKRRNELHEKYLAHIHNRPFDELSQFSRKSGQQKRKKTSLTTLRSKGSARRDKELTSSTDDEHIKTKAEMLTAEVLGPFEDPFHPKTIKRIEGYVYSVGNMTLAYLNLAYNNLSYMCIKKLLSVIKHQNNYKNKGLVKVVLDGNNLPISCPELAQIEELMSINRGKISRIW
ncbi:leucine-rich repeat-containing protein 71-like [Pararge aegeria]|uniref:leucine-rich repeat-containing protein 71-like n=1 Tax=Pararge aegeria TaxID=116150 RepID=UPI0019D26ECC|nr:leucine-rich repeat-containing protein 71-like [Pararge aegeria]